MNGQISRDHYRPNVHIFYSLSKYNNVNDLITKAIRRPPTSSEKTQETEEFYIVTFSQWCQLYIHYHEINCDKLLTSGINFNPRMDK